MSSFTLQEYRIQREYRQNKRKQYLKRFELLKQKTSSSSQHHNGSKLFPFQEKPISVQQKSSVPLAPNPQPHRSQPQVQSDEYKKLVAQNDSLKQQLESIEAEERKKLMNFKEQISSIKEKYINQIKAISAQSQKTKSQTEQKMKKIMEQMVNAQKKNQEIKKVNDEMKKEVLQGDSTIGMYITQIKNEYSKKLNDFQKIFTSSNDKIQQMQSEFNEQEFVQNALKNEQLLKTIQQNASKSEQAVQILEDYKQLLDGKNQILKQITSNMQMKQSELTKMNELEGKMKVIFEKMNEEKKTYIAENQKMTKELMEIKTLIMGFLSQAEGNQKAQAQ